MAVIQSHRDLIIWQRSMSLAAAVYSLVGSFPDRERYGLISQLTRAAVSVPTNISEGFGRASRRDYSRFLAIARGSLMEVDTLLRLSGTLGFTRDEATATMLNEVDEISRMIAAIRRKLDAKQD